MVCMAWLLQQHQQQQQRDVTNYTELLTLVGLSLMLNAIILSIA